MRAGPRAAVDGSPLPFRSRLPGAMTPPATGLYEAVVNGSVMQSGDLRLNRHVGNVTVRNDNCGARVYREHKHSGRRIHLAVCAIMAHSVAATPDPGLQLYWYAA